LQVVSSRQLSYLQAADHRFLKPPTAVSSNTRPLYFRAADHRFLEPPTPVGGYPNPQWRQIARNPPAHPLIQSNPPACAGGSIWSLGSIGYSLVSLFKPPTTVVRKHQLSYFQAGNYRIFEPPTPVGGYATHKGAKSPETRQRIRLFNPTRRLAPAARYGRWSALAIRL